MPEPIDGQYFNWLRRQVLAYDAPSFLYLDLLNLLYRTEFVYIIMGDENRAEDGIELRLDFLRETNADNDLHWFQAPCSVLEVLIAFARRAAFETDMPSAEWFWRFIANLRLDGFQSLSRSDRRIVERVLETWMWRIYDYSGYGGLFPLHEPDEDQRKLEIWYQFNRYIDDQGL
jgi:hypothetical protein